jgi:hypothetical protein
MEEYWRSGGIAPCFLDLGTRWRWVVSFMPQPLYFQGKSPWYPLGRRLGGPQSRSGRGGEEKNSQPLPGLEPPIIQSVEQSYNTELSRLLKDVLWMLLQPFLGCEQDRFLGIVLRWSVVRLLFCPEFRLRLCSDECILAYFTSSYQER